MQQVRQWLQDAERIAVLTGPEYLLRAVCATATAFGAVEQKVGKYFTCANSIDGAVRRVSTALRQQAITSLSKAIANGKPGHLCLLQLAYAYLNDTPPNKARARECLKESEKTAPKDDPYYWKHIAEVRRVLNRMS